LLGLKVVFFSLELGQFLVHFDHAELMEVAAALDDWNIFYAAVHNYVVVSAQDYVDL
jgi:hypothetical protein